MSKSDDLHQLARRNAEAPFRVGLKRFTVSLNVSPNAKTSKLEQEFTKGVYDAFKEVHGNGCIATAVNLEIILRSRDTLFDLGKFEVHRHAFRKSLEKMGLKRPGMKILHIKSEEPSIDIECSFRDVLPLEHFKTECGGAWGDE